MNNNPNDLLKSYGVSEEMIQYLQTARSIKDDPNGALRLANLTTEQEEIVNKAINEGANPLESL